MEKPDEKANEYENIAYIEDFGKRILSDEELADFASKVVEKTKKDMIEYRKNPPKSNVIFWRSNKLL